MNAANDSLRVNGVGRDASDPRTLVIYFNEKPSDNDMRRVHDLLRDGAGDALATEKQVMQALKGLGLTEREWEVLTREGAPDDTIKPRPFLMEFAHRIAATSEAAPSDGGVNAPTGVDWLGLALDLEAQSKRVESQTVEGAMLAAARGLRLMGGDQ